MKLRWTAITCDAQRLLTVANVGEVVARHATGRWMGGCAVRAREAPPWQINAPNSSAGTGPKRRQRRHQSRSASNAEPGSRYPEGDGLAQEHIFRMLPPPVFDHPITGTVRV